MNSKNKPDVILNKIKKFVWGLLWEFKKACHSELSGKTFELPLVCGDYITGRCDF